MNTDANCVGHVVAVIFMVAAIAAVIRSATAKGPEVFRRRGWYVYAWVLGGAAAGGRLALQSTTGAVADTPDFSELLAGYVGSGVLIGVALGNLHAILAVPDYCESSQQDNNTPY